MAGKARRVTLPPGAVVLSPADVAQVREDLDRRDREQERMNTADAAATAAYAADDWSEARAQHAEWENARSARDAAVDAAAAHLAVILAREGER